MAMSAFLGKLATWIMNCIIGLLVGSDVAFSSCTRRINSRLRFKNQVLSIKYNANKGLTEAQNRYIKKLKIENDKLNKDNSKQSK